MFLYGHHTGGGARIHPDGTARDRLIRALGVAFSPDQSREIVDALDAYLSESDREVFGFEDMTPDYRGEAEKLRAERDAAVRGAEQVIASVQKVLDGLRGSQKE